MRLFILIPIVALYAAGLPTGFILAQQFTKITTGDIVTTPSDSRSINCVDVNGDGRDDLFISNGPRDGAKNMLYLNNGNGTFTTIADDAIVSDIAPFDGATFGDVDNDGDIDCIVVTWYGRPNYFYRNEGSGTFSSEFTTFPGMGNTYSESAAWGDYDRDGYLDLYLANSEGDKRNMLFHNKHDGTFERISEGVAVTDAYGSRGVSWVDYDGDGDADLYVANENNTANCLYRNEGNSTFTKITGNAIVSGARSSMSASWGDTDNDGDLDLVVANSGNFTPQNNQYFRNDGNGAFTEITDSPIATDGGCSFSSSFADYDNDGDLDLLITNGFCSGNIVNFLYKNDGSGNFIRDNESIADLSTPCSYGCGWGDFNNDGFPDAVIATCQNRSTDPLPVNQMFMNNGNGNKWSKITLQGVQSNRSAVGATVRIQAIIGGKPVWQLREISTQNGYCSQNSLTAHFGLGNAGAVDSVLIHFPSGKDTVLLNVPVNKELHITEDIISSVEEEGNADFRIEYAPNPAQHSIRLTVFTQKQEQLHVRLINTLGTTMKEYFAMPHNGLASLDMATTGLTTGVYYISVSAHNGRIIRQVIVTP